MSRAKPGPCHMNCCCTAGNPTVPPPRLSAIYHSGHDGMVQVFGMVQSMHALGTSLQQSCHYWCTPLAAHHWLHSTIAGTSQSAHAHLIGLLHLCAAALLSTAVPRLSLRYTSIEVFLHNAPCFSTRHTRSMPLAMDNSAAVSYRSSASSCMCATPAATMSPQHHFACPLTSSMQPL